MACRLVHVAVEVGLLISVTETMIVRLCNFRDWWWIKIGQGNDIVALMEDMVES